MAPISRVSFQEARQQSNGNAPSKQQQRQQQLAAQSSRHLLDDMIGRSMHQKLNFARKLLCSLRRQRAFLFTSLIFVVGWSCLCAAGAEWLANEAANDPGGPADQWLGWIEGAGSKFRMIGILFVFLVVFRFNRCYDRWNQGRIIWGKIIALSLDATRMASYWIVDDAHADRFARFVIVFPYACKALLRGNALSDSDEEGPALIERGFLTQEELEDMESNLGWQPQYCLEMLSAIWIETHYQDKTLMFDQNHKVYSQLFRAIDGVISQLGTTIGEAVRVRASGLPETYDGLHHVIFYFYFALSPIFYAPTVGWVLPFLIGLESLLIMFIVVMGSDLVQPFGTDRVDLPLDFFCETIEVQAQQIRERSKCKTLQRLARTSNTQVFLNKTPIPKSPSAARGIKVDHKKVDKGMKN